MLDLLLHHNGTRLCLLRTFNKVCTKWPSLPFSVLNSSTSSSVIEIVFVTAILLTLPVHPYRYRQHFLPRGLIQFLARIKKSQKKNIIQKVSQGCLYRHDYLHKTPSPAHTEHTSWSENQLKWLGPIRSKADGTFHVVNGWRVAPTRPGIAQSMHTHVRSCCLTSTPTHQHNNVKDALRKRRTSESLLCWFCLAFLIIHSTLQLQKFQLFENSPDLKCIPESSFNKL